MNNANCLIDELKARGIQYFTGVPCSYLSSLVSAVNSRTDVEYITASSEGESLAIASGIWLGNTGCVVMCQNSGLGNMVNPLTSLNTPFGIPVLLLVSWRGKPGEKDEPQHKLMGEITMKLLELMNISWAMFPKDPSKVPGVINGAFGAMSASNRPYALIIEKETFLEFENNHQVNVYNGKDVLPTRAQALECLVQNIPSSSPLIATTGKTGRELYALGTQESHLYCVGSMGYANALAHGLSLTLNQKVFIIDGDGAVIMHLGNLTSIGANNAENLVHVILDNAVYDSTGGQETVASKINFGEIAKGAGYQYVFSCNNLIDFSQAINKVKKLLGPSLIHLQIKPGSMKDLGRPSLPPFEIARRLKGFTKAQQEKKF